MIRKCNGLARIASNTPSRLANLDTSRRKVDPGSTRRKHMQKTQPISAATERALKRVARGETAYSAAKKEVIALSTIYRALRRIKEKKDGR